MYKKQLFAVASSLVFFSASLSFAAEKADTTGIDSPGEWNIRMMPVSESAREAARWTPLLKNDIGTYDYEQDSVKPDEADGDIVMINLRIAEMTPDILVKLNAHYAEKLGGSKVAYMEKLMAFHRKYNTFATLQTKIFSANGALIEDTGRGNPKEVSFHLIPEKSVAEAALEKIVEIMGGTEAEDSTQKGA